MANLITTIRFGLLFVLVVMAYRLDPIWQLVNAPLLALIFALDGVDGYVARRRGEESLFGSIFDIAADRVVENVLWIVMVDLGFVPVWVAIVFITRGFLVDSIRSQAGKSGGTPFGMMRSVLGRWLVGGRFMRITYAVAKMLAFGWIFLIQPWPSVFPTLWASGAETFTLVKEVLVYLAVILCIARGLPVVVEFVIREHGALGLGPGARQQRPQ
ncbi:MAG: CDP-alcohol phosphatidyltransferase family protein [Gammaproteobacteria bacterium]|nr:CDP-alcohol phosphatidyltransferase family protein [Gammaproteobacteria bacterium]